MSSITKVNKQVCVLLVKIKFTMTTSNINDFNDIDDSLIKHVPSGLT